jgi:hypothetical protein
MNTPVPPLSWALALAVDAANLTDQDAAAVALAEAYMARIDADPDSLVKIGHLVLPLLTALGLTPAARNAVKGAGPVARNVSPLDDLRARRATRANRAKAVDQAAT